jgi:hypothetical protein
MTEQKETGHRKSIGTPPGAEQLVKGIAELTSATLGVGAAFARIAAQATAGERPVPPPPESATPLTAVVHYSAAALVNVVDAVRAGMGEVRAATGQAPGASRRPEPAATAAPAPPSSAAQQNLPTVHPDSTLRMPLSIENTGPEPMVDLQFQCLALEVDPAGPGVPLTVANVRFEPAALTVAPRDFEKLTVYVDVPDTAAPGRYQATIGLESGTFRMAFPFVVALAESR